MLNSVEHAKSFITSGPVAFTTIYVPDRRIAQEQEIPVSIPGPATFIFPSDDSRRAVISYWRKNVPLLMRAKDR